MVWGSPGGREELGAFGTWKRASVAKGQSDGSAKGPSFSEARQCWGETGVGRESVTGGVFGFPPPPAGFLLTDTPPPFTELLAAKKTHTCE